MNAEAKTSSAGNDGWPASPAAAGGWSWRKTWGIIGLAFAIHVVLLFLFATRQPAAPRAVVNAPQFEIATSDPILVALDDPTLFAVPHVQDLLPSVWRQPPEIVLPPATLTEPSPYLLPDAQSLGTRFAEFMATNRFANNQPDFKPEPRFSTPIAANVSLLPTRSTLKVTGDLAGRLRPANLDLPALSYNDVIAPSVVQVLVGSAGNVLSAVLLPSSSAVENAARAGIGDTNALNIARGLHFTPAAGLTLGNLIFHWHTTPEPPATTNAPAGAP